MSEPVCDFLSVTFPRDDWPAVREAIQPALDAVGCVVEQDDAGAVLWRHGDGTVRAKTMGVVMALGASGAVLAGLRLVGAFGAYLSAIGSVPHRVTRLDAALDIPEDTPPVIESLLDKASSPRGLSLTRKRIRPEDVTRLVSRRPDGRDTGTCYLGGRQAEVRAAVYDKRQERLAKGLPDVGPLTRYELRLKSGAGATLRDAYAPAAVFWHFMAPDVLPRPADAPAWAPGASGFSVDWPGRPTPAALLRRRVESSPEVAALVRLAATIGPYGKSMLLAEVGRLFDAGVRGVPADAAFDSEAGSPPCNAAAVPAPAAVQ